MVELNILLDLSKSTAVQASSELLGRVSKDQKNYYHSIHNPKEIKSITDKIIEKKILAALIPTGLPVLSEEAGYFPGQRETQYRFIVDPLDGTFNFVKGLGPCAISIALWKDQKPIFGVVYSLLEQKLFWGGDGMGAYCDNQAIQVSDTLNKHEASLCTGFPARFDSENDQNMQKFWSMVKPYAKVRMLGSAAISLVNIAKGAADVYLEQNIMLWDVAAGIAIVEGAGGYVQFSPGTIEHSNDVHASNRFLSESN